MMKVALLAVACFALAVQGASIRFQNTYGNNMVLQKAPQFAHVWGYATTNDKVTVKLDDQSFPATVRGDVWSVTFPAQKAGGPHTITAQGTASGSATLTNVMFGDVYVCSGQSNMQFTVHSAFNATTEIAEAAKYPQIRVFTVGTGNISLTPLSELASFTQPWSVASPDSIGKNDWGYFSAVCWFYGKYLADANPGLPIGLISTNWGGTYVQAWSSPNALAKCKKEIEEQQDSPIYASASMYDAAGAPNPNQPSVLYNAMIVPFLGQTIFGALWYQGEANAGDAKGYACMFPAMISDWRTEWNNQFPFFFVQLAPWTAGAGTAVADTRQAQLEALKLPGVGFATAVDLGDVSSPQGNIHPRDKQTVGARLLLSARAIAYKQTDVVYRGPEFVSVQFGTSGTTHTATVLFTELNGGLVLKPATCPTGVAAVNCANWAFLLSDGKWYPTSSATLDATSQHVIVSLSGAPAGATATGLRYAYSSWPQTTVFSKANLPAIPFEYTK
eukprot:TRINITY_DN76_c0_g1_i1.p1 TRINITY_DN76_c0_g1~~TRINITY_DN76_c0_g1_i1.p1  ORF type:complete len:502 (-),score=102.31 TRINITY_DN76_c0_g1_i1:79-1584(-)